MPATQPVRAPIVDVEALKAESPLMPMVSFIRKASSGRLLNMHLQMAAAPVVPVSAESQPRTMVAVGLVAPGGALPNVVFSHRRRKVRASLHPHRPVLARRSGKTSLAEAR